MYNQSKGAMAYDTSLTINGILDKYQNFLLNVRDLSSTGSNGN
jgi:hypothetical protein